MKGLILQKTSEQVRRSVLLVIIARKERKKNVLSGALEIEQVLSMACARYVLQDTFARRVHHNQRHAKAIHMLQLGYGSVSSVARYPKKAYKDVKQAGIVVANNFLEIT